MIDQLEKLVDDVATLQTELVLLIGPPGSGKTALLRMLGDRRGAETLRVGAALALQIVATPSSQRPLVAPLLLRDLADSHAADKLLLLDNIELLFDHTLRLDPLDLLKRQAHGRRVVAAWPGEMRDGRLTYARRRHPEHRDYSPTGFVPFLVH